MYIKQAFRIDDVAAAREIVARNPFATIVTADLRATHMPCLLDHASGGLGILGHVALADPVSEALDGPVLLIFQGPHGYVSASWYASDRIIPTWNHVTLHVRGRPEVLADALPVLRRTVARFEAAVAEPWSLDRMGAEARAMADRVVAFRLVAPSWHAERKLSQDKPGHERDRVLAGLEAEGPYRNPPLAAEMREAS